MAIAVLATIFGPHVTASGISWIVLAMVVGGAIGLYAARTVQMTQMPELVALMHSLVGLAAVLVGYANYIDPGASAHFGGADMPVLEVWRAKHFIVMKRSMRGFFACRSTRGRL